MYYTQKLTLKEALAAAPFKIKTLDGRTLPISLDSIITPQTVHCIQGEGMPSIDDPEELLPEQVTNQLKPFGQLPKGSLFVSFDVQFPTNLDDSTRK